MRKLIFEKYAGNPVLTASQFPSDIMYVMNPGAIKFNGEYLLLVDAVLDRAQPRRHSFHA